MHPIKPSIRFFYEKKANLLERSRLKGFLRTLFRKEKQPLDALCFIFCSDEYLLGINKEFLGHDFYTDIITFNLADKTDPVDGEIYISVDRVKENAQSLDLSFKSEFHRVIFHGALHLCGYMDKKPGDRKKMRKMEDMYLELYFR